MSFPRGFCTNCGGSRPESNNRFCSKGCRDAFWAKQADLMMYCVACGTRYTAKPWNARCTPCWQATQHHDGAV